MIDSGLHGLAFFGLLDAVNDALGKEVDLLDTSQIKPNSRIEDEVKMGVQLYG